MYQQFIVKAKEEISTVRSIIKTNENIRNLISKSGDRSCSKEYIKIIENLKSDIPKTKDWIRYDHCFAVTQLYAIYENFVENLIGDWLIVLPKLFVSYSELDERIQNTHRVGIGRLLIDLNKNRYEHLSIDRVISSLNDGISNEKQYELLPEAFLFHEQNLRREILEKLLADAGIDNTWTWVEKHRNIKNFVEEIRGSENTAEGELNELISYRNEAAHGAEMNNVLRLKPLLELCDFVESFCQALVELFAYKTRSNVKRKLVRQQKSVKSQNGSKNRKQV
ncbi:MAG: MAE_28990/MAE_18760 family HEPN-like nuclease [Prochloraceae cyanobacterium]